MSIKEGGINMKTENGITLYNSFFVPTHFVVWIYDAKGLLIESFSVRGIVMRHINYWRIKYEYEEHICDMTKIEKIVIVTNVAGDDDVRVIKLEYEFEPNLCEETVLANALKSLYDAPVNIEVKDFTK